MKRQVVQPFLALVATDAGHAFTRACCGPALLLFQGRVLSYSALAEEAEGECCHPELEAVKRVFRGEAATL